MPYSVKYKTSLSSIFVRFPGNFIEKASLNTRPSESSLIFDLSALVAYSYIRSCCRFKGFYNFPNYFLTYEKAFRRIVMTSLVATFHRVMCFAQNLKLNLCLLMVRQQETDVRLCLTLAKMPLKHLWSSIV